MCYKMAELCNHSLPSTGEVKEARYKVPHFVWAQLYDMSGTDKSIGTGSRMVVA